MKHIILHIVGVLVVVCIMIGAIYAMAKFFVSIAEVPRLIEEVECLNWANTKSRLPHVWFAPDWQKEQCKQFNIEL